MRARFTDFAKTPTGAVVPGVLVNVYQEGTTTPITETIYAADTGGAVLTNPLTANAQGVITRLPA